MCGYRQDYQFKHKEGGTIHLDEEDRKEALKQAELRYKE